MKVFLGKAFHQIGPAVVHIDHSRADPHVAEARLRQQRIEPAANESVAAQPGLDIHQALDGPCGVRCLRMTIPGAVVALNHRDRPAAAQDPLHGFESGGRLRHVLQQEAQEDMVEVLIGKRQVEQVRLVELDIAEAGCRDPRTGLDERGGRDVHGHNPRPRILRGQNHRLGPGAAAALDTRLPGG